MPTSCKRKKLDFIEGLAVHLELRSVLNTLASCCLCGRKDLNVMFPADYADYRRSNLVLCEDLRDQRGKNVGSQNIFDYFYDYINRVEQNHINVVTDLISDAYRNNKWSQPESSWQERT